MRAERSGELSLVIGNGCCDSTAPFLFEDYLAGPNEERIGVYLYGCLNDLARETGGTVEFMDVEPGRKNVFAAWGTPVRSSPAARVRPPAR